MAMSDRIAVVWNGQIVGQFGRGEVNEEQVMSYALGLQEQRAS
jgi:ABC-type sugar transport system ATPase subunit